LFGYWKNKPPVVETYSLVSTTPRSEQKLIYNGENTIGMIRRARRGGVDGWTITVQGYIFNTTSEDFLKIPTTSCKFFRKRKDMYDALEEIFTK
jgi:hypothetical protein